MWANLTEESVCVVLLTDASRGCNSGGPSFPLSMFISGRCGGVWRTRQKRSATWGHSGVKAKWKRLLLGKNRVAAISGSQVCLPQTKLPHHSVNRNKTVRPEMIFFALGTLILPMWLVTSWLWLVEFGCIQVVYQVVPLSTLPHTAVWSSVWTR